MHACMVAVARSLPSNVAHTCRLRPAWSGLVWCADPNAPEQSLIPTSPRSVEACFRLGIDPLELQFHPITYYKYTGEAEEIAKLRFEKNEQVRR